LPDVAGVAAAAVELEGHVEGVADAVVAETIITGSSESRLLDAAASAAMRLTMNAEGFLGDWGGPIISGYEEDILEKGKDILEK
jgi:hypothetical protein